MECRITKLIVASAGWLLILFFGTSSCYYDDYETLYGNAGACDTAAVTFSQDINALIGQNCEGCHNGMSANGGLILSGHQNTCGCGTERLFNRPHDDGSAGDPLLMPPGGALSDCDISKLRKPG